MQFDAVCTKCTASTDYKDTHEEAELAWNRRAEPENKPLTLEQLKRMEGEPVWVENLKNPQTSHWWVVEELCHGTWDNYGKTWLAYARKAEGSAL